MLYLKEFIFPTLNEDEQFVNNIKRSCYDSFYPFGVLGWKLGYKFPSVVFEPITIFYGGNGSGKTTALNVIAEKIGANRDTLYNRTSFFNDYLNFCRYESGNKTKNKQIITSDDVFDFMLNLRYLNEGLDNRREDLFSDYLEAKYSKFRVKSLEDYDQIKKTATARRQTQSKYIRENMMDNVQEHSNGESAFIFFTQKMREKGLYLLDEPENSLSPERQQELAEFFENSARFFDTQIIMATHSPFMLSIRGAKIYDLDETPACVKKWTQLPNIRTYFDFFMSHKDEF